MSKLLGQSFMIGVTGLQLSPTEADFIKNNNIGGVILFAHNYEAPAQIAEFINDLQKCRDEYPLFISVDHEGGRVQRFKNGFTHFPSLGEIGKLDSPKTTYEVHQMMGEELKAVGVNLNYSPVCDVWSNPQNKVIGDRAFGDNPEIVEKHVSAAIRGLQAAEIITCAKHFPGHGSTKKDSHLDLPFINHTMELWEKVELPPFKKAAKSRVDMIMMAHLIVDIFDKDRPCTISPRAYKLIREVLKFDKITITDDLEMSAIKDHFGIKQASVDALQAGADIVLYRSFETAVECFEESLQSYEKKILKASDIQDKFNRITDLKKERLSNYQSVIIPELKTKMKINQHAAYLAKLKEQIVQLSS